LFLFIMPLLNLSSIEKAFGPQVILEGASLRLEPGEKTALIGANGTGKTTILKMVAGIEQPDSGAVWTLQGTTVGYLPQDPDLPEVSTVLNAVVGLTPALLEAAEEISSIQKRILEDGDHSLSSRLADVTHTFDGLGGFGYQDRAKAILNGLGLEELDWDKPVGVLSGGQKTRAALAKLLLQEPDLLLLDEPTNHLDIEAIDWLQDFLNGRYNGAALIVSHDRYFLDKVVTRVLELENYRITEYEGNYARYAQIKAERREAQLKAYKLQQKEITRLEAMIQSLFSQRKFAARDSKQKQLQKMQRINRHHDASGIRVNISAGLRSGKEVIHTYDLSKRYGDQVLFDKLELVLEREQRVGVVGPNGSGKSTLLKIITDQIKPDSGEVELGHNVQVAYFAQDFSHLQPQRTVVEEMLADADVTSGEARNLLAQFLFTGDDPFKKVEVLSGGERCRLALAKILAKRPNCLLLDEPTNHLDIPSREALEAALTQYNGTILVASHDRYLLNAVANYILEVKDGKAKLFHGDYSSYREKAAEQSQPQQNTSVRPTAAPVRTGPAPSRLRILEREQREREKRLKAIEDEIHQVETRLAELSEIMADPETYKNGSAAELAQECEKLNAELPGLYNKWEALSHEIETAAEELQV
jgi:ATP-binding cassette subfamily F protein 3